MGLCIEIMRKFDDYLRGELPKDEADLIRTHVAGCEVCGLVLTSAERTLHTHFPETDRRKSAA